MRNLYVISYDLNQPEQKYAALGDAIKGYGTWWHHLGSTWIVATKESAREIRDKLLFHLDSDDKLLVARLGPEAAWYGFKSGGSNWLNEQFGRLI